MMTSVVRTFDRNAELQFTTYQQKPRIQNEKAFQPDEKRRTIERFQNSNAICLMVMFSRMAYGCVSVFVYLYVNSVDVSTSSVFCIVSILCMFMCILLF